MRYKSKFNLDVVLSLLKMAVKMLKLLNWGKVDIAVQVGIYLRMHY